MSSEVVIAAYRPRPDRSDELLALIREHVPLLRNEGLATSRPVTLLRSRLDGTYLEIFEWVSQEAIGAAHENELVKALWKRFAEACEYVSLAGLAESENPFPAFDAVDGVVE